MAIQRYLSRAPIAEALIDVRVVLRKDARDIEFLRPLGERIREEYPDQKTIQEHKYELVVGPPQTEKKTLNLIGFRYTNKENTHVIQATVNGLSFSRLTPYKDWEQLREEASRIWSIYSHIINPLSITRVATRYINKLELPGPYIKFEDYLVYPPPVPSILPPVLGGFYNRIVVPHANAQVVAIITQVYQPGKKASEAQIVLDIDVFRERPFGSEEEAWNAIDELRGFKNMIFFDSITEKTAELYQ